VLPRPAVDAARTCGRWALTGALGVLAATLALLTAGVRAAWRLAQSAAARWVLPPSATLTEPRTTTPLRLGPAHGVRELSLTAAVVLLLGLGAAGASTDGEARAVTAAAQAPVDTRDRLVPLERADAGPVGPRAARSEARGLPPGLNAPTPAPLPVAEPAGAPAEGPQEVGEPVERWLPTGTGMWLHDWALTEGGNAGAVVARATAGGLSHLYVQTGSTKKGWIGDEVLRELLPATKGVGLDVIAWDFPKLVDPEADAQRMADAATWRRPGVPRVAAVAPDVETAAEGTHLSPDAVARYYTTLRRLLPEDVAVLATVPWPSEKRIGSYPYAETAPHVDAFVPMAYWYNRAPGLVTATSMQWLAGFGKPVMPVGQGYDSRLDAPYLPADPDPSGSVQAFVDAARAGGARSVSLWSWQTTGGPQWDVLVRAGTGQWPVP
jgi:hypothetical protein